MRYARVDGNTHSKQGQLEDITDLLEICGNSEIRWDHKIKGVEVPTISLEKGYFT